MMDHITEKIDPDQVETTIGWMQALSGQDPDVFNFAEWLQVSFKYLSSKNVYNIIYK